MNHQYADICIDVWGDYATFTKPYAKVERMTYPAPTPSACRGMLNAIYSKPIEFYYEITQIDIMKPIRFLKMKKNEVKDVANIEHAERKGYYIDTAASRTQRFCTYLCDVYYRIHAKIVLRDDAPEGMTISRILNQFNRRVSKGKCFYQPGLGTRECMCFFSMPNPEMHPIDYSEDIGTMLYDVFDIKSNVPLFTLPTIGGEDKNRRPDEIVVSRKIRFFHAKIEHGSIKVPPFEEVVRGDTVHV